MMECQASESKKLFQTFDGSRRKKSRRKRDARDHSNSVRTDGSTNGGHLIAAAPSAKSLHALTPTNAADGAGKRERGSSSDLARTLAGEQGSPRRQKRHSRHRHKEATSLALKAGVVSTPRSDSPSQDANTTMDVPRDQDSFIYALFEDAIKDKKKHRQKTAKKDQRDRGDSPEPEPEPSPERVSRRQRRDDDSPSHTHRRKHNEEASTTAVDQKVLMKAFSKLCKQMSGNAKDEPVCTRSNKSLHCKEEVKGRASRDLAECQRSREHSRGTPPRNRSRDRYYNLARGRSTEKNPMFRERKEDIKPEQRYYHDLEKFSSKINVRCSRRDLFDDRYPEELPAMASQTRSRLNALSYCRDRPVDYSYKEYDDRRGGHYKEDGKRYCEQKTSRSFDIHREPYMDEDRTYRRTSRSDTKAKHYEPGARYDDRERKYVDREQSDAYYDRPLEVHEKYSTLGLRDKQRSKRNTDIRHVREDDRDRYSERERDSGLSVADGETSTVSGRSTYFRVVKQEISEQREAMDKMMNLWKDLMKCFKGIQQPTDQNDKSVSQETAESSRESAAAQLQLWRECMRRYETVARDVGDTDARLMDEINKQRSEMAEMATMWQECLQRYRDMSKDFNNLKEKIAVEAPRMVPPAATLEGDRAPASSYRVPPSYPPPSMPPYLAPEAGSPLRARSSAPPPWQWWGGQPPAPPRRRQSSPESRGSRERRGSHERRQRHKDRDRDDTRYKEKSKSSAPRSDNRRRKR